jgi:hypothetical protein
MNEQEIVLSDIDHEKYFPMIEQLKDEIRNDPVIKKVFKDYDIDFSEFDMIPICVAQLPVSARTDHAVIYLNEGLLKEEDFLKNAHYLVHEMTHWCQQTTGNKPTPGSDADDYLYNPAEVESFQNQTQYISHSIGDEAAEEYINQVLDKHEVTDKKERKDRTEKLLNLAGQLGIVVNKNG